MAVRGARVRTGKEARSLPAARKWPMLVMHDPMNTSSTWRTRKGMRGIESVMLVEVKGVVCSV